jgi:hypothetical protein
LWNQFLFRPQHSTGLGQFRETRSALKSDPAAHAFGRVYSELSFAIFQDCAALATIAELFFLSEIHSDHEHSYCYQSKQQCQI